MEETTATTPETNTAENTPQETEQKPSEQQSPTEKTFTQKELDDIVKQRLDRAKKDMPTKDELKAFREWKDSQKTAEQKAADVIALAARLTDDNTSIEKAVDKVLEKYPAFLGKPPNTKHHLKAG